MSGEKGWQNKYGAVLFCEKEGFQPLFEAVKLGERYDLAVMSSKGTSVTAARTLIDAMIKDGIPVYCIRDFDFVGFNIAGTLARDTRRYAWNSKGAVDFGLRLADVKAWGLASERVYYKNGKQVLTATHAIRAKIVEPLRAEGATEEEITFLETHRVELNAFTSGDLVKWIESKLDEHGVKKVVPDDKTLVEEARCRSTRRGDRANPRQESQGDRRGGRRVRDRRLLLGDQDPGSLCPRSNLALEHGAGGHRARRCLAQRTAAMTRSPKPSSTGS